MMVSDEWHGAQSSEVVRPPTLTDQLRDEQRLLLEELC